MKKLIAVFILLFLSIFSYSQIYPPAKTITENIYNNEGGTPRNCWYKIFVKARYENNKDASFWGYKIDYDYNLSNLKKCLLECNKYLKINGMVFDKPDLNESFLNEYNAIDVNNSSIYVRGYTDYDNLFKSISEGVSKIHKTWYINSKNKAIKNNGYFTLDINQNVICISISTPRL